MEEKKRLPSFKLSLIAVLGLLAILLLGILIFKIDVVILLVIGIIYIGYISNIAGYPKGTVYKGMIQGCTNAFIGLLFVFLIGAIIGVFISSGTVPTIVYYGINIINPKFFLPSAFIICAITSSIIGTSWGTIATVGIAITSIAVGSNINIPYPAICGAIVSGAWFGDKMSPISDSTVITSTAVSTDVYSHIKAMAYTTLPSFFISLIVFFIINSMYGVASIDTQAITAMQSGLKSIFNINILTIIPVIVLIIMSFKKIDAIKTLLVTIFISILIAIFVQKNTVSEALASIMHGVSVHSSNYAVEELINRGGVLSMLPTFLLVFFALTMGGLLEEVGFLQVIINKLFKYIKSTFSLILTTMGTSILGNAIFGDVYLTIILNANIYKKEYEYRSLHKTMLSRTISESATMSAPLIPWTAPAAFILGTLGVSPLEFAPFAVFNFINPIFSLILTSLGLFVFKAKANQTDDTL